MNILGIETSCDDTAAAILSDGKILSEKVASQLEHADWGGVVPEIASRAHLRNIYPVVDFVLRDAGIEISQLDSVAVTAGPGLAGALLVGLNFARGISDAMGIPLIGINHLQAHAWAAQMEYPDIEPPFIALLVSGGHTSLVRVDGYDKYTILGQTLDDAAGEVLDKIGRLCGLTYPCGAEIERLAINGGKDAVNLPRGMIKSGDLNFSFSGLKTAGRLFLEKNPGYNEEPKKFDFLASLQESVLDVLVRKTETALSSECLTKLVLGGGVAANSRLRLLFHDVMGIKLYAPSPKRCTDNGSMIAHLAWKLMQDGKIGQKELSAVPGLKLDENL